MDVIDAIKNRRSVRKFLDKAVSKEILMDLIEAARLAPSGNNVQPWKFKMISCPEEKEVLRSNEIFRQAFVYDAPALILCSADPADYPASDLDDANKMRAIRDLALASQNLVLRATELGLGTCYIGWVDREKIKKLFNIPENFIVPYVIAVGYPDGEMPEREKKRIDDIVF